MAIPIGVAGLSHDYITPCSSANKYLPHPSERKLAGIIWILLFEGKHPSEEFVVCEGALADVRDGGDICSGQFANEHFRLRFQELKELGFKLTQLRKEEKLEIRKSARIKVHRIKAVNTHARLAGAQPRFHLTHSNAM